MDDNSKLKWRLIIQSLSPLALLTIVNNWKFSIPERDVWGLADFIQVNMPLLVVMIICVSWLVSAATSFIVFKAFKWSDRKSGYQIQNIEQEECAGLNFFLSMIVPLLIDNVSTVRGAITLLIIVLLLLALLEKTNMFYANPVLAILGYRIYKFNFVSNSFEGDKECIGICQGKIVNSDNSFEYKKICGSVYYIKEQK